MTVVGTVLVALIRSGAKHWSETQLSRAKIMKEISDNQRADTTRVVDMMITQARSDAKLIEEIHANGAKIDAAIRERDKSADETRDELKEMSELLHRSESAMRVMCQLLERYVDESQSRTVYRPKRLESE